MTLDLYVARSSPPCYSVLMTAEYLGINVNAKIVNVMADEQLKPEYIKMNPQHTVPTLDDNGFYLWESRAIQKYLVNKYAPDSPIYPKDPKERAIVDRMLYFDIGTLYAAAADHLYPPLLEEVPEDPEKAELFKKTLTFLEGYLEKTAYVAGNSVTLADFSIIGSLTVAEAVNYSFADYPKITAWMQKMKSKIPSYQKINEETVNEIKEFLKSKK